VAGGDRVLRTEDFGMMEIPDVYYDDECRTENRN